MRKVNTQQIQKETLGVDKNKGNQKTNKDKE